MFNKASVFLYGLLDRNRPYFIHYAPNFEKVGSILVSACPCVRPCVRPYKPMGTPVAIKFGQLDTEVVIFECK